MANRIRSASGWDMSELSAYNIETLDLTASQFFEVPQLPPVPIEGDFITVEKWENMTDPTDISLAFQMSLVMGVVNAKGAIDLFVIKLLERLGFTNHCRQLVLCQKLPLEICGETRHATPNVSLVTLTRQLTEGFTILLVHENKNRWFSVDPVPQLIGEAIAAATANNRARERNGMAPLAEQVIPAISLVGTAPTFYRVPVSISLMHAVLNGECPTDRTIVLRHRPVGNYGMAFLEDRKLALRCFKAFKKYIDATDNALCAE